MGFSTGFDTDSWPVIKARWYKAVNNQKREVRLIVIHSMEAPEKGKTAENVANYFKNLTDRKASAHLCIDNNSIVQCVYDNDIAWAAPGANHNGIQLELAGYARQSRQEWLDPYSLAVLENAASAAAQYCLKYDIPPRHLTNTELENGDEGLIGHVQATEVFRRGSHTDPGDDFPWDDFLSRVEHHLKLRVGGDEDTGGDVDTGGDGGDGTGNDQKRSMRHVVKRGETLGKIAKAYGVSLAELLELNPQIRDPNLIYINDVIRVPGESLELPHPDLHPFGNLDPDEVDVMARTIYGEARGESAVGKHAVGWVILNRVAANTWYGSSVEAVCLKPYQFSCWNFGDPNFPKLRSVTAADRIFAYCIDAAEKVLSSQVADPTGGATHYHANYIRPPAWTLGATLTVRIGIHLFYKDVD